MVYVPKKDRVERLVIRRLMKESRPDIDPLTVNVRHIALARRLQLTSMGKNIADLIDDIALAQMSISEFNTLLNN